MKASQYSYGSQMQNLMKKEMLILGDTRSWLENWYTWPIPVLILPYPSVLSVSLCTLMKIILRLSIELRYVKATPEKGLFFEKTNDKNVAIFTNIDWKGSVKDRKSSLCYCTFV